MGQASWLVAGIVPGIERQPLKKLATDQEGLLTDVKVLVFVVRESVAMVIIDCR